MRSWLDEIAALDPVADAQAIYRISAGFEFPWDYRRSLELALFSTYCVPSISRLRPTSVRRHHPRTSTRSCDGDEPHAATREPRCDA